MVEQQDRVQSSAHNTFILYVGFFLACNNKTMFIIQLPYPHFTLFQQDLIHADVLYIN